MYVYTRVHIFILLFYFSQFDKFAIMRDIFLVMTLIAILFPIEYNAAYVKIFH